MWNVENNNISFTLWFSGLTIIMYLKQAVSNSMTMIAKTIFENMNLVLPLPCLKKILQSPSVTKRWTNLTAGRAPHDWLLSSFWASCPLLPPIHYIFQPYGTTIIVPHHSVLLLDIAIPSFGIPSPHSAFSTWQTQL